MSKKKAQHFVPRFYLKNFSIEGNQTHLGIYNKKNHKFIPNGVLKHQAYINNYYDDDGEVEKILSEVEAPASKVISLFLEHKALPIPGGSAEKVLRIFTLISSFRTKSRGDELGDLATKFFRQFFKHKEELKEKINEMSVEIKFPATYFLDHIIQRLNIIDDLKLVAVINLTEIPFITSDNPVALYNQFVEKAKCPLGVLVLE